MYQDPKKAWEFTVAREAKETRHVDKGTFVNAFFTSKENTKNAKKKFGEQFILNLLIKNLDNTDGELYLNIQADELDYRIKSTYSKEELGKIFI